MEHIGIDLGSRESQVCIRNSAGDIVEEARCGRTDSCPGWRDARGPASSWRPAPRRSAWPPRRSSWAMMSASSPRRWYRALGVGQRGLKNDQRDARTLSEASCRIELPSVHIPSAVSQEVKAICVSREALVARGLSSSAECAVTCDRASGQPPQSDTGQFAQEGATGAVVDAEGLPAHLERAAGDARDVERTDWRRRC